MSPMVHFWQHLPSHMHPVIFSIGPVPVRWYSVMYLLALVVVYALTAWRIRRGEVRIPPDEGTLQDFIITSILGIIVGGRIGYVLVYDLPYYWRHPMEAFLPFSLQGGFHYTGFTGMSFHGGLIGVLLVLGYLCRKRGWALLDLTDSLAPAIPLGYTFGRLGNFVNGELFGRVTDLPIGMYFPLAPGHQLRFPSQLFEAGLEGLALFAVLWPLRNTRPFRGFLSGAYLIGYGVARFLVEFTRQPDPQLDFVLGPFTMGQVLCFLMIVAGGALWLIQWRRTVQFRA